MSEETNVFKRNLEIDLSNLHVEWQNHAHLRLEYSDKLAKCEKLLRKEKELLKTTRSILILKIREEDPKAIQKVLEAKYRSNEDYLKIKENIIELEYERDMIDNAVKACDDRKHALQKLVALYLADYYAVPHDKEDNVVKQRAVLNNKRKRNE
jgi:hypothetical protein